MQTSIGGATMINDAMFSSNTNEWATPQAFFDELNKEFDFTLDPCATPQNAKCARYFTKEIDGLAQSWRGEVVFCNPPYGRDISKWAAKAYAETLSGGAKLVVLLIPARTDTAYFHDYIYKKARNTFRPRTLTLQRKQMRRAVSVNGCRNARSQ
jgi:site-specific DNA-methyltransferase (adenine-specific)